MIAIDAHLDLSWNAVTWDRDLTLDAAQIREDEQGMNESNRGANTVSFPEMRKGKVAVSLATLLARAGGGRQPRLDYRNQEIAYAVAQGQLAYYRAMERDGYLRMLRDRASFDAHFEAWEEADGDGVPLGFILSMEGADPITSPGQVFNWWDDGLRAIGLVHYGARAYAHGTGSSGGLTAKGRDLLKVMEEVGMMLDVTHLSDDSFWQATEVFHGPILASHHNCRALVPGDRQLTDEQIQSLIERDSVIGAAFDAWMLDPSWVSGQSTNKSVSLDTVLDHIDHICQLAGSARHCALGTDLDGGFGREKSPHDLDTIADLQKIPDLLRKRGYQEEDVKSVMYGNWARFLRCALV
jgi:membrane dipeptidase